MSETLQMWLFGGAYGGILIIGTGVFYLWIGQEKIKTAMIMVSRKAFDALHSPSNHLGLDELIDEYRRRHYELTPEQWQALHDKCEQIKQNPDATKHEIILATLATHFSEHKLKVFGGKFKL